MQAQQAAKNCATKGLNVNSSSQLGLGRKLVIELQGNCG
jgi:hypothetical protein